MSTKKYRIRLTYRRTTGTHALVTRSCGVQTDPCALADESRDGGMKDADSPAARQSTVERIRKRCVEEGVEPLNRKKPRRPKETRHG